MKRIATVAGVILLASAIAIPAFAHGKTWGRGYHKPGYWHGGPGDCCQYDRGYENLTKEQRDELDKLRQKYHDQNIELRNQIRSKSAELHELLNSADPDAGKARSLQGEISDLRAKLAQNRLSFELEVRKIAPELRFGRGYGRPYGPGKGYGDQRGYGPRGYRK